MAPFEVKVFVEIEKTHVFAGQEYWSCSEFRARLRAISGEARRVDRYEDQRGHRTFVRKWTPGRGEPEGHIATAIQLAQKQLREDPGPIVRAALQEERERRKWVGEPRLLGDR